MKNSAFIIAEAGVNHNGSLEMAKQLIDAAADAGVDAVKFQTFKAEKLVSKTAAKAEYQSKATDSNETQFQMIKKLELDEEAHAILIDYCKTKNIAFLSTPFDEDSVDFLVDTCKIPLVKVSSGDLTNAPLLLKMAQKGKPMIISSGMSMLSEIEQALGVIAFGYLGWETPTIENFQKAYMSVAGQKLIRENVSLLHCTTEYPTPYNEVNLRAMDTLKQCFQLKTGFSDHTSGISIPIAAVARGAEIIEKHFTLDKELPGPDHKASLDPLELKVMVKSIREVEDSLGSSIKIPAESEIKNAAIANKSILASQPIKKGQMFSSENVTVKRPGTGMSPYQYWELLGKESLKDYVEEEPIN